MEPFKLLLRNKKNSENLYPIILRINKDRRSKIITLGISCKKEDWDEENYSIKRSDKKHLQKNIMLNKLEAKAKSIIEEYSITDIDFSLEEFEIKFRGREKNTVTVYEYLQEKVDGLIKVGKIGGAKPYIYTKSKLFKFANKSIKFRDITPEFLKRFEAFLRIQGNGEGGIKFLMIHIRVLFNEAIINDIESFDCYPFRKYKISKLKGKKRRIALSINEWKSFENVDLSKHPNLFQSYQYFLFSYYTRGMNFTDMMSLKWSDIRNGRIYYTRKKTQKNLVVKIQSVTQKILSQFSEQNREVPYVFPILLSEGLTPTQIFNRKHKILRKLNQDLKVIAGLAGILSDVTTYVARHSYATHMKQNGESVEVICESMGHSSVLVTMSYLKDFEDSFLDEANDRLFEEMIIPYKTGKPNLSMQV